MKTAVDERCLSMIRTLSEARGPSGFEDEAVNAAKNCARDLADISEDSLRNLYIRPRYNRGSRPVLMLDAHSDEVGFMIHSIKPNGTLRFLLLGEWNEAALPGTGVRVRNARGEWIRGVIASKPPHFMTSAERSTVLTARDLVIDVGAVSDAEARDVFAIRIGEPAVPDTAFSYDPSADTMIGKSFDCRIGCAAMLETLRRLWGEPLSVDVVGVMSSQEELGERGCTVAVRKVAPQAAIVFEGCPADDTFTEPYAIQTALKKGPMLRFMDRSILCNPRFQRFALDLAEKRSLAVQSSVREGGGNNGSVIHTSLDGIPAIVLGVPVRYIHSGCGITSYYDFEAAVRLAVDLAKALTPEIIAGF